MNSRLRRSATPSFIRTAAIGPRPTARSGGLCVACARRLAIAANLAHRLHFGVALGAALLRFDVSRSEAWMIPRKSCREFRTSIIAELALGRLYG